MIAVFHGISLLALVRYFQNLYTLSPGRIRMDVPRQDATPVDASVAAD